MINLGTKSSCWEHSAVAGVGVGGGGDGVIDCAYRLECFTEKKNVFLR